MPAAASCARALVGRMLIDGFRCPRSRGRAPRAHAPRRRVARLGTRAARYKPVWLLVRRRCRPVIRTPRARGVIDGLGGGRRLVEPARSVVSRCSSCSFFRSPDHLVGLIASTAPAWPASCRAPARRAPPRSVVSCGLALRPVVFHFFFCCVTLSCRRVAYGLSLRPVTSDHVYTRVCLVNSRI